MKMRLAWILVGIALPQLTGCYKTSIIPSTQLNRLANCGSGDCTLVDSDGDQELLDDRTEVTIVRKGERLPAYKFVSVHLQEGSFVGVMANGERLSVPLASIQQVELRRPSAGRTMALIFIPIGIIAVLLFVFAYAAFSGLPSG